MEHIVALLTLTVLEIVLGIDNLIFIAILVQRLPEDKQPQARAIGLSLALVLRIGFLFLASTIAHLVDPLFGIGPFFDMDGPFFVTGRDLIMMSGGLFLLAKATTELHNKLEGDSAEGGGPKASFGAIVTQIIILDVVFSIDSVIMAVGLSQTFWVMIVAVVVAVIVMQLMSGTISRFIVKHPTIKILALSFLMMVGLVLVAEALHFHVPRGYVYFSMAFSMAVEFLNLRYRARQNKPPVELRAPYEK
ncbi:MAG: TerC family protein [bacterium]|nr:TerC family protein [bacterium]